MIRLSLALILLFIAPSAWGQKPCGPDEYVGWSKETGTFCGPKVDLGIPEHNGCITTVDGGHICGGSGFIRLRSGDIPTIAIGDGPGKPLAGTWTSITNGAGTFTPPPSCDPGWSLVMDASHKPQCAWVLKEPIYK